MSCLLAHKRSEHKYSGLRTAPCLARCHTLYALRLTSFDSVSFAFAPLPSGNAIAEPATVITRIAQTFLRFGSFEIFKPTDALTGVYTGRCACKGVIPRASCLTDVGDVSLEQKVGKPEKFGFGASGIEQAPLFHTLNHPRSFPCRTGSSAGLEADMLPTMLHFTIKNYFPDIWSEHNACEVLGIWSTRFTLQYQ
eukprot:1153694-Pelagomonas_calceolata.AAC.5